MSILSVIRGIFGARGAADTIPALWREAGGSGVRILVIDTGKPSHRDLTPAIDLSECRSFVWDEGWLGDDNGHATAVCSVIRDWAPKARVICHKAAGKDGKADSTAVRLALEAAAAMPDWKRPHVVNISLSARNGASKWRAPIRRLFELGVPVVCGAGNDGGDGPGYPAMFPETVSVGAVDDRGKVCDFSAGGADVDCLYPGKGIRVRAPGGGWRVSSGTSLAAPAASAVAALCLSHTFASRPPRSRWSPSAHDLRRVMRDYGAPPPV